jgi:hypothetical protein
MIQFILDNKEWIFSGIGVVIIFGIMRMLLGRRRIFLVIILLFANLLVCSITIAQPVYTKSSSLSPIRVTYDELESILSKASAFMSSVNANTATEPFKEKIVLEQGESKIEIPGHNFQTSSLTLPKVATRFTYTASDIFSKNVPIISISIDLDDYKRTVKVEGRSPEQVDALFALLKNDLNSLSSALGGYTFRFLSGSIIFTICMCAFIIFVAMYFQNKRRGIVLPSLLSLLSIILLFILPFNQILAGFSVSKFNPSFVARYAPHFSLWGFIITFLGIFITYILTKTRSPKASAQEAGLKDNALK